MSSTVGDLPPNVSRVLTTLVDLHDVPDSVYELLELVGTRAPHPVDVVLERDGAFPAFDQLLMQVDRARAALSRGRARAVVRSDVPDTAEDSMMPDGVSELTRRRHAHLEGFLARLYTDATLRARFEAAPADEARLAGFTPDEAHDIAQLDRVGLRLAAASFARKRGRAATRTKSWLPRLGRRARP
jgi:hypothetical protein